MRRFETTFCIHEFSGFEYQTKKEKKYCYCSNMVKHEIDYSFWYRLTLFPLAYRFPLCYGGLMKTTILSV